jgi:hypothetical protein
VVTQQRGPPTGQERIAAVGSPADQAQLTPVPEVLMYAVVNHMKLSRPLDDNIIGRMNDELMANIAKTPGVVHGLCVQVADDGIVIIVICASEEALERVHQEVGSPWVGENLGPYLAGTDRKTGPVIARSQNLDAASTPRS